MSTMIIVCCCKCQDMSRLAAEPHKKKHDKTRRTHSTLSFPNLEFREPGHVALVSFPRTQSVTASTVMRRGKPQSIVCSPIKLPGEILWSCDFTGWRRLRHVKYWLQQKLTMLDVCVVSCPLPPVCTHVPVDLKPFESFNIFQIFCRRRHSHIADAPSNTWFP